MVKQTRNDLKINGNGKTPGGEYSDVTINGMGKVNGDLDCISFRCNGDSDIYGNLKAESTKINGSTDITGDLKSGEVKISGYAGIGGGIESKQSKIEGQAAIGKSFTSDDIVVRGIIKVKGDCNAETFSSHGGFNINGLLNAGKIDVKLYAPSNAKEIGGEEITVRKGTAFILKELIKSIFTSLDISNRLSSDTIEGDDIYLEFTKANVVRGNNIKIGEGCEIGLVEYKNSFHAEENSKVKEHKKI